MKTLTVYFVFVLCTISKIAVEIILLRKRGSKTVPGACCPIVQKIINISCEDCGNDDIILTYLCVGFLFLPELVQLIKKAGGMKDFVVDIILLLLRKKN